MAFVALTSLILIIQYMVFMALVGRARGEYGVKAPAMTGHEMFERRLRIQLNTHEQLMITLPAMWINAYFFRPDVAAALGLVFFVGRILFARAYMTVPEKRAVGMVMGFLSNVAQILCSLWGVLGSFF